jgi:hypothetical protein
MRDDAQLIESLSSSGNLPPVIQALLSSSQPEYKQAGIEALLKMQGPKPAPQMQTIKGTDQYGRPTERAVQWNSASGSWEDVSAGSSAPQSAPQTAGTGEPTHQPSVMAPAPVAPQQRADGPPPFDLEELLDPARAVANPQAPQEPLYGQQSVARGGKTGMDGTPVAPAPAPPPQQAPAQLPAGVEAGPPAPKEMIGAGLAQDIGPDGSPLWRRTQSGLQPVLVSQEHLKERAKAEALAPERDVTNNQIAGNLGAIAGIINDVRPDQWDASFGQYGGAEKATLYEDPLSYVVGSAKRSAVALGEELFGKEGQPSAAGLRRKIDAPAADLVMTYRAIQKQRGVTDSQQSNADLAFLESVGGRLKETNSREEAYDILQNQVRPIFERLTGQKISIPKFNEWKKIKKDEPGSSNFSKRPEGSTDNQLLRQALTDLQAGGDRKEIESRLKGWGVKF